MSALTDRIDALLRERAGEDGTVPRGTGAAIARAVWCDQWRVSKRLRALGLTVQYAIEQHGTLSRAVASTCPCQPCRDAKNSYAAAWRAAKRPEDIPHGTATGYRYGCRCAECRRAHADDARKYYHRHRAALAGNGRTR
jgi:hypothetical protein